MAEMNLNKDWGFDFNANQYFGMEYGLKNIRWKFRLSKNYPLVDLSYEKRNGVRVDNLGLFFKKNATKGDLAYLEGKTITDCVLRWGCVEVVDEKTGEVLLDENGAPVLRWANHPTVVRVVVEGKEYGLHGKTRGFKEPAQIEDDAPAAAAAPADAAEPAAPADAE